MTTEPRLGFHGSFEFHLLLIKLALDGSAALFFTVLGTSLPNPTGGWDYTTCFYFKRQGHRNLAIYELVNSSPVSSFLITYNSTGLIGAIQGRGMPGF